MVGDRERRVGRRVLGDEADPPELRRALGGTAVEHLDRARRRLQQADREMEQRRLAGPVRADEPDDLPGGDRERAVAERPAPAVLLAEPVGLKNGGHATSRSAEDRKVSRKRASMLSSSSPARRALANQRCRSMRSGPCAASEASLNVPVTNVPTPGRAPTKPGVLELPIGLEHRVRVDRQARHDVLDGRQLVTLAQQPQPQRPPHLLDDLQVRRDAGTAVQVELDRLRSIHLAT